MTDEPQSDDLPANGSDRQSSDRREGYRRSELFRLASAQCDQSISPADLQRLEQMLSEFPAAQADYVAYMDVHTGLDWEVTSAENVRGLPPEVCETNLAAPTSASATRSHLWFAAGVVAASLVIGGGMWWMIGPRGELPSGEDLAAAPDDSPPAATSTVAFVSRQSAECHWTVSSADGTAVRRPLGDTQLRPQDTVVLRDGRMEITFASGVVVTLDGSAVFQVLSPMRAIAMRGKLTARVVKGAEGFTIETPGAQVVDLGTVFGLEVDETGHTDVVVFRGKVDLHYGRNQNAAELLQSRRLRMGEALRVDMKGEANRIVSVDSLRFIELEKSRQRPARPPLIVDVYDNIRQPDNCSYYEIVWGGMREDAKACVDREFHEFNGVDADGMPPYLIGGDYIKMFNNDKGTETIEVYVTLDRPARLFVLFDDRTPPPPWLVKDFRDTGDDVGMDVGQYTEADGTFKDSYSPGVGPGVSVDNVLSVWERIEQSPGTVRLGSTQATTSRMNMYGIVAMPVAE